jgi:hypothetical protein
VQIRSSVEWDPDFPSNSLSAKPGKPACPGIICIIPDGAVEGSKIMKWLRAIAPTLAKAGVGMAWTSPAGLPVVHEVREPKEVFLQKNA